MEFHEDEYLAAPLSDRSLRLVALFNGPEVATKLLFRGDHYVRLDNFSSGSVLSTRSKPNRARRGFIRPVQNKEDQTPDEAVYAVFVRR